MALRGKALRGKALRDGVLGIKGFEPSGGRGCNQETGHGHVTTESDHRTPCNKALTLARGAVSVTTFKPKTRPEQAIGLEWTGTLLGVSGWSRSYAVRQCPGQLTLQTWKTLRQPLMQTANSKAELRGGGGVNKMAKSKIGRRRVSSGEGVGGDPNWRVGEPGGHLHDIQGCPGEALRKLSIVFWEMADGHAALPIEELPICCCMLGRSDNRSVCKAMQQKGEHSPDVSVLCRIIDICSDVNYASVDIVHHVCPRRSRDVVQQQGVQLRYPAPIVDCDGGIGVVEQTSSAGVNAVCRTSNQFQMCTCWNQLLAALLNTPEEEEEGEEEKTQGVQQSHRVGLDGHLRHGGVHINSDG
ncbi:MAG: hypothetical protein FRX49_03096 [Trebouxia sp. A1-2]|nr:MAG: hypothetical protein FRX49_03096 [Trebouxia sp. A1-2]